MRTTKVLLMIITMISLVVMLSSCSNVTEPDTAAANDELSTILKAAQVESWDELSPEETAGLIYMREEEKLARDVYKNFYQSYNLFVFNNISKSEQAHTNAIKYLLNIYQIEDPAANDVPGAFQNEELQQLYNTLIAQGGVSINDALLVGGAIEEIDILDLQEQIDNVADNIDIIKVYSNLKRASGFHLRAFVRNLQIRGIVYSPQYLDQETYDQIINGK